VIETTRETEFANLPAGIRPEQPLSALAPMQDVTDLAFINVVSACGSPDYFFTEYFRVTQTSRLEADILRSITHNETGRPIFAQMIGEDVHHLKRTATDLRRYKVAGIDLNMGCPAPKVYKKNVGGGLLRDPVKVDAILGALRDSIDGLFTVKMRIGFDSTEHFGRLLELVNKHGIDLLSLHGRTVKEMYRSEVHYEFIAEAVRSVRCPVLANGNVTSAFKAEQILRETHAAGVMIGRSAIRNPWIFKQVRAQLAGEAVPRVPMTEVRQYVDRLYRATQTEGLREEAHIGRMKKFLNFVGQGIDADGNFLHEMRRTRTIANLFEVCDRHLLDPENPWFADEPFSGVLARPNRE
jgi:nifR3 family TIM-barrel protein